MKNTSTDDRRERAADRIRYDLTFIPTLAATDTPNRGRGAELERLARELAQHRHMLDAAQRHVASKEDEILHVLTRDWSVLEVEAAIAATLEKEKSRGRWDFREGETGFPCRPRRMVDVVKAGALLEAGIPMKEIAHLMSVPKATLQRRLEEAGWVWTPPKGLKAPGWFLREVIKRLLADQSSVRYPK